MRKMTNDVWVLKFCERYEGCSIVAIFEDYENAIRFAEDDLGLLQVMVEDEPEWIDKEDLAWFNTDGKTIDFFIIEGHDVISKK